MKILARYPGLSSRPDLWEDDGTMGTGLLHVNDSRRLRELAASKLMDSPSEECFDRFTRLACRLLNVPISLVSLVDERRQFFKSSCGLSEPVLSARETGHSHSFCKHVVGQAKPLIVQDARKNGLVRENLAIRDLGVIAYAGFPLRTATGQVLGSFCAIDTQVRDWKETELDSLEALADSVATEISLRMEVASHKESQRRLRTARDEAQNASETKSRFLASVSHELRTPLNSIIGFAQMLHDSEELQALPRQLRYSANVIQSGNHLLALIDQILDLSQVEIGKLSVEAQRFDLVELVRCALLEIQPQVQKRGLEMVSVFESSALDVDGDPARVRQVLLNLLSNAIKFTDRGTITVECKNTHDTAVVTVMDTGQGLRSGDFDRIFEPFERLSLNRPGTGLGLSISRELTELMGGTLEVTSPGENRGSTFTMELPKWAETDEAREAS